MLDDLPAPEMPGAAPLTPADFELVQIARNILVRHYRPFWHTVASAIRSRDGRVWTGIHLGATVGRLSICAEAVALGRAVMDGDATVETIVAVRHPKPDEGSQELAIVSPCGACRENVCDYDPLASVIVQTKAGPRRLPIAQLLPSPYRR